MSKRLTHLLTAAATVVLAAAFVPAAASNSDDDGPGLLSAITTDIVKRERLPSGETQTTIRMGPIPVSPHRSGGDGDHGHAMGTHTTLIGPWAPPCNLCYVTGVEPNLTYADGSTANYDTGVMLHHAVLFDRSKTDVTCGDSGTFYELTGRRIFASGNERTGAHLPEGYGVKLGLLPLTWGVIELMSMSEERQYVYVDAKVTHVPAWKRGMTEVTPVWLDAANCSSDSLHSVPAGESTTTWEWPSTISGTVMAAGGHLHDGGQSLTLSNATTGEQMCTSEAGYGTDPSYMGHIESMSVCTGDLGTVRKGDDLRLDSVYDMHHPTDDVMTILMAFVAEDS